jgi:ABC-type sugar transport system permease subunit
VSIFIYKLGYHIGNLGEASAASVILVALMIVPLIFAVRYMVADVSF